MNSRDRAIYLLSPPRLRASRSPRNLEIKRRYDAGEPLATIASDHAISSARVQHIAWCLGGRPRHATIRGLKIRGILERAG